ncbi:hypothetical protein DID75_02630 [Candidatus Marinamargulisbacteria bacterium SCGC AG-410-N11]|nr:hypothetical protein DID75_02630 [Candidatus Marinamargulisbacteria bacterium SCGC AG-410-N11]
MSINLNDSVKQLSNSYFLRGRQLSISKNISKILETCDALLMTVINSEQDIERCSLRGDYEGQLTRKGNACIGTILNSGVQEGGVRKIACDDFSYDCFNNDLQLFLTKRKQIDSDDTCHDTFHILITSGIYLFVGIICISFLKKLCQEVIKQGSGQAVPVVTVSAEDTNGNLPTAIVELEVINSH